MFGVNVDLGVVGDPGGNSILGSSTGVGLYVGSTDLVLASGNTWHPGVQGASATATYPAGQTVSFAVTRVNGNNYAIGGTGELEF